ncbi:MAG: hypothetical protein Q8L80_07905 [Gallionella sp.]|nr:hypothetical protein [Gallionella sp.]MDP1941265.1 hypothetical protein [Gallionella sp.]
MSWLDKFLMKIAMAKLAARSTRQPDFVARELIRAFRLVNSSGDTPPLSECEEQK